MMNLCGGVGVGAGPAFSVSFIESCKKIELTWKFTRQEFLDLSVFKKFLDETARISDKRLVAYMSGGIQCDNINYNVTLFIGLIIFEWVGEGF